jgi:putative membrane protein
MRRLDMKRSAMAATLIGLALALTLLLGNDLGRIGLILLAARWSILIVVALHLPQILFSTLGWRALIAPPSPDLWTLCRLRWIRDSVNTLLPVARVGGDFIRVRLLAARGMPLIAAAATTVGDVSLEMGTQILFTMGAVMLLLAGSHYGDALPLGLAAVAGSVVLTALLYGAQRLGLFRLIERLAERLAERGGGWARLGTLSGLHEAVLALYRHPRRIWLSGGHHLLAWLLGGLETYAALRILGLPAGVREAIVIEALGHAARAAGFLIPGALGVQEGGYLLICTMFGIGPQDALALSLIRRIRELILGVPGLILWHQLEHGPAPSAAGEADLAS